MFRDPSSNLIFVARQRRLQEPPAERCRRAPGAERHATCQWVSPADRPMLDRARHIVAAAKTVSRDTSALGRQPPVRQPGTTALEGAGIGHARHQLGNRPAP